MPNFCSAPFYMLDIKADGSCWICCEQWLPHSIGNLYTNTLEEIWNGPMVREIRESILDQNFKFCDNFQCPVLSSNNLDTISSFTQEQKIQILDRSVPKDTNITVTSPFVSSIEAKYIQNKLPSQVNLSYDQSCNLQCPSCRKDLINFKEGDVYDRIFKLHTNVIDTLFQKPHDQEITINITGSGDPFASKIYRDFLYNFDPTPWPNLKLGIQTHGGLLTSVTWERLKAWHSRIEFIKICFDAATEETYKNIRRRGNWDQLMLNCEFLNSQIKKHPGMFGIADFVVQSQNFKEMPKFAEMILTKFQNFSYICFYAVNNWGTWTDDEFLDKAVWKDTHSQHANLKKILQDPIFNNPKVILGSFNQMR